MGIGYFLKIIRVGMRGLYEVHRLIQHIRRGSLQGIRVPV